MWGIHDDIRRGWKAMLSVLKSPALPSQAMAADLDKTFTPLENAMREMFYKEEHILFPAALQRLTLQDWQEIYDQEADLGFAYVTRASQWRENPNA